MRNDLAEVLQRLDALERAPADEAASTLVRPRRRAPAWLGWVAAAIGAAYAGYDQTAAAADHQTADAVVRLERKLDELDAKVDALATEVTVLRAAYR